MKVQQYNQSVTLSPVILVAVVSPVCVHVFSVDGEGACTNVYVCICVCACLLLNVFSSKSQLCCVTYVSEREVPFVKFILYSVLLRLIALYFVTLKRVENWSLLLGLSCRV